MKSAKSGDGKERSSTPRRRSSPRIRDKTSELEEMMQATHLRESLTANTIAQVNQLVLPQSADCAELEFNRINPNKFRKIGTTGYLSSKDVKDISDWAASEVDQLMAEATCNRVADDETNAMHSAPIEKKLNEMGGRTEARSLDQIRGANPVLRAALRDDARGVIEAVSRCPVGHIAHANMDFEGDCPCCEVAERSAITTPLAIAAEKDYHKMVLRLYDEVHKRNNPHLTELVKYWNSSYLASSDKRFMNMMPYQLAVFNGNLATARALASDRELCLYGGRYHLGERMNAFSIKRPFIVPYRENTISIAASYGNEELFKEAHIMFGSHLLKDRRNIEQVVREIADSGNVVMMEKFLGGLDSPGYYLMDQMGGPSQPSPIHIATINNDLPMVKLLHRWESGCLTLSDMSGWNPLVVAMLHGNQDVVEYLRLHSMPSLEADEFLFHAIRHEQEALSLQLVEWNDWVARGSREESWDISAHSCLWMAVCNEMWTVADAIIALYTNQNYCMSLKNIEQDLSDAAVACTLLAVDEMKQWCVLRCLTSAGARLPESPEGVSGELSLSDDLKVAVSEGIDASKKVDEHGNMVPLKIVDELEKFC